jgi:hypothetical protein
MFDSVYSLNVKVPYFLIVTLAPLMAKRGKGAIVNVGLEPLIGEAIDTAAIVGQWPELHATQSLDQGWCGLARSSSCSAAPKPPTGHARRINLRCSHGYSQRSPWGADFCGRGVASISLMVMIRSIALFRTSASRRQVPPGSSDEFRSLI